MYVPREHLYSQFLSNPSVPIPHSYSALPRDSSGYSSLLLSSKNKRRMNEVPEMACIDSDHNLGKAFLSSGAQKLEACIWGKKTRLLLSHQYQYQYHQYHINNWKSQRGSEVAWVESEYDWEWGRVPMNAFKTSWLKFSPLKAASSVTVQLSVGGQKDGMWELG